MSSIYLKVKIKSLAEEALIIRKEERRALEIAKLQRALTYKGNINGEFLYRCLRMHRKSPVGTEARYALIAYGFLRGKKYKQIEQPKVPINTLKYTDAKQGKVYYSQDAARPFNLINKYGPNRITFEEFEKWIAE